ncbi:hypothetical protein KR084_000942 [Drosophila pseudotakahashii]|nr:hypothetical protein KR084_000942 [Drosophila pseudotakahashii]
MVRAALECRLESVSGIPVEKESVIEFNFRLLGRERLLNGTVTAHVDLDDEFTIKHYIYCHRNGEWEPSLINVHYKICAYMALIYEKYFVPFLTDSNLPTGKDACPFKKGEYYLRNIAVTGDNWVHYARMGLVRSVIEVTKNNITYGGLDLVLFLSEKVY